MAPSPRSPFARATAGAFDPLPYLIASLAVGTATGISEILWPWIGLENTDLVFLTAIVGIAVRFGLWPSLFASAASALCYNFFFPGPLHLLGLRSAQVVAILFFTVVAIIVSNVAARARSLALAAMGRARTTKSLYVFSRKLSGVGSLDEFVGHGVPDRAHAESSRGPIAAGERLHRGQGRLPSEDILDQADLAAARWAWEHDRAAGRGADTLPGAKRLFLPMRTGRGAIGVVGIDSDKAGPLLTPDQRRLLDALIDQAALAIERITLVDDLDRAEPGGGRPASRRAADLDLA